MELQEQLLFLHDWIEKVAGVSVKSVESLELYADRMLETINHFAISKSKETEDAFIIQDDYGNGHDYVITISKADGAITNELIPNDSIIRFEHAFYDTFLKYKDRITHEHITKKFTFVPLKAEPGEKRMFFKMVNPMFISDNRDWICSDVSIVGIDDGINHAAKFYSYTAIRSRGSIEMVFTTMCNERIYIDIHDDAIADVRTSKLQKAAH